MVQLFSQTQGATTKGGKQMKSDWQYVNNNGTTEKMAPKTLVENVMVSENGPSLKDNMPSNPNLLMNGDFKVWQRGTSFTGSSVPAYKCDRWIGSGNLLVNASKHDLGLLMETATSGLYMGISQRIEMTTIEAYQYIGKTLTLSYKLRGNQAFETYQGNIVPAYTDFVETTSISFTQSHYDFVAANGYSNIIVDRIGIKSLANGSILPLGFWTIFEWVKLEVGSFATPFVPRTYIEELAMCQRYYENSWFPLTKSHANEHMAQIWSAGNADMRINYTIDKRIVPAITVVPEGSNTSVRYYATNGIYYQAKSHSVIARGGVKGDIIRFEKSASDTSTWTPGQSIQGQVHWEANAEIY